jgi:hypothetical protein
MLKARLWLLALSGALACSDGGTASMQQPNGMGAVGGTAGAITSGGQGGGGLGGGGTGGLSGAAGAAGTIAGMGAGGSAGMATGGNAGVAAGGMSADVDAEVPEGGDGGTLPSGVTSMSGVIVPTAEWDCGLPGGIPAPETGALVLDVMLELEPVLELGHTPYGSRQIRSASGGSASGDFSATAIEGGLDWELTLPSGARELETRHVLRTSAGALIYMRGCGVGLGDATRLIMTLEVAGSTHADLREGLFVATREVTGGGARFAIYRVPETPDASAPKLTLERSAADRALRPQLWSCTGPAAGASAGPQAMEATVRIGGSLAIGSTQNGSRNIIPITGGTFTGMGSASAASGEVIPGGADFQVTPTGGSFELEARYTLRTDDGTLIAVRNCGRVGGTEPQFETALDSPYAFLNDNEYFGRIGIAIGAVIISVFDSVP